jgi:glycosyltransferase involved in cell wall biosynthesis
MGRASHDARREARTAARPSTTSPVFGSGRSRTARFLAIVRAVSADAARPLVTIDARMLHSSGIGTYLRAVAPRVIERLPEARFCLLGKRAELEREAWVKNPRVECRELAAGVYSALEQPLLFAKTPSETRVFWSPHVNVPVLGPGRLLVTVHDVFYADPPPEARPRLDKWLYLRLVMKALRARAAAVMCDSDFTKRELLRLIGDFSCPVRTVHLAVEAEGFVAPACERPHAAPYLVYVGNLKPHKNIARTLEAFSRIAARVPHDFLLVGGGDVETFRRPLAPELASRVHFVGFQESERLRCYLAHASGLVLVSLYEGFGLPPLEAMALGVPALVSREASLPEVCADGALYADARSVDEIARGLEKLLMDETERASLRTRGMARARELDWDKTAAQVEELMRGLL